jgi:hypothetical protein
MKKSVLIQLEIDEVLLTKFEAATATENLTGAQVLRQLMREYVYMHCRTEAHNEAKRLESAKRVSAIVALDALMASNHVPDAVARFADDDRDVDEMGRRQHGWVNSP